MEDKDIDILLAKVLAGEASSEEEAIVKHWSEASPENKALYEKDKALFECINSLKEDVTVDTNAAWNKLEKRLEGSESKIIPLYRRPRFLQAAASVLLIISLGFILKFAFFNTGKDALELSAKDVEQTKVLPDGSKIILDKQSQLSYNETKAHERRVKLKGSAHFSVVHNEEKEFVIEVNEVLVKDIGTAFYVKELKEKNLVEVSVEEGEVQFYTEQDKGLRLVKNESATYNTITKEFIRLSPSGIEQSLNHLSRRLNFENSTLEDVIEEINSIYSSNIQLSDPKMKNCRLSVNFSNEELEVMLSVIAETLDLKIQKQDSVIILQGKPCAE